MDEAGVLKFLDPQKLRFHKAGSVLRFTIEGECSYLKVGVFRCFPLSEPSRYLSVRDGAGKEIGVIKEPKQMRREDYELVMEELHRRYLTPRILRILAIKERFGVVEWEVETDRGKKRLLVKEMRENLQQPEPNRCLITDVDGNRYDIPDVNELDAKSLLLLRRYL